MKRIAIIRVFPVPLNPESYNVQEIGLARALVRTYNTITVDVYARFFGMSVWEEKIIESRLKLINVPFWGAFKTQGICISLLFQLWKKSRYDIIQCHDESQITNVILSFMATSILKSKVLLYQGMYSAYTGFFKKMFQRFFNLVFLPILRDNCHIVLAKSKLAKEYLEGLGFRNISIVPVGLDKENLLHFNSYAPDNIIAFIKQYSPILLYIGILDNRRNLNFTAKFLPNILNQFPKTGFLVIGNGPGSVSFNDEMRKIGFNQNLLMVKSLPQNHLPFIYKIASCFLLPTQYEIFGMVIAECIWFGLPVVTTHSAGVDELFRMTNWDGLKTCDLDDKKWSEEVLTILKIKKSRFISTSREVRDHLLWENIVPQYISALVAGEGRNMGNPELLKNIQHKKDI
jgi:glycosyltransferase involved in cell wall biosynthesis